MTKEQQDIFFVVNPVSGTSGKKVILRQLEKVLDQERFSYTIAPTQYAGHAEVIAREAAERGVDIVCAIGGDGTVNEVARALVHTDTALAIIPCGSGNGLARHLHVPMDVMRAVKLINRGEKQVIDYGLINEHPFFCTCGVGLDAFISQKFAEAGKRGLTTYVENALKTVLKYTPQAYELEVVNADSEHHSYQAVLIACANASQWGNNAYIAPHASVRDGLLDVIVVEPFSMLEAAGMAIQLMHGSLDKNSKIKTLRCKKLYIKRGEPGPIHFDGDPMMACADLEVSVVPQALRCICGEGEGVESMGTNFLNVLREYTNNLSMHSADLWQNNMFRKKK